MIRESGIVVCYHGSVTTEVLTTPHKKSRPDSYIRTTPHTHSGKNNVENVIDNKTNAYYSEKNADGAEAVHILCMTFSFD